MLDHFTILTQGGLVLWSKHFTPTPSPCDQLIREALIEQRINSNSSNSTTSRWDKDQHTLLWLLDNSLDLIFVVTHQRILSLTYPPELLERVKIKFLRQYQETLEGIVDSTKGKQVQFDRGGEARGDWTSLFKGWDGEFNRILKDLESNAAKTKKSKLSTTSRTVSQQQTVESADEESTPADTPTRSIESKEGEGGNDAETIARNIAALKARQKAASRSSKAGGGKKGGSGYGTESESGAGSESDASPMKPLPAKRATKSATKWADSSLSAADLAAYDYSTTTSTFSDGHSPSDPSSSRSLVDTSNLISKEALGKRDEKSGMYEVADYEVGADSDSDEGEEPSTTTATTTPSSSSTFSSFFSRLSLSSSSSSSSSSTPKLLTQSSLDPILTEMQSHLISKNVASPIAQQLCQSVGKSLEGKKLQSGGTLSLWGGSSREIKREVRKSVEEALTKVLTPKNSIDLLLEITRKKQSQSTSITKSSTTSSVGGGGTREPYSITFVGVNGVGKSTNLSKVAFWLLQNKLKVLIAACDTFRSGAVEQLRVHVGNLGRLEKEMSTSGGGLEEEGRKGEGKIELFEKGYGKDAAGIAKDALSYAKQNDFDVVLIDTAGRMQDNEPLMRALAKLISVNQPDKIIFVGEALVGNEAVDQLTKFNRSLRDFSSTTSGGGGSGGGGGGAGERKKEARGIDGMILTKFDTIDDKVGAALSMTYTTGQPIYFVGCGQTYSDLRMLRVGHIVQALLN